MVSHYVVDGTVIAGLVVGTIGVSYLSSGLARISALLRVAVGVPLAVFLAVAVGFGAFQVVVDVASLDNVSAVVVDVMYLLLVASLPLFWWVARMAAAASAMSDRQLQLIGLLLTLFGVAAQFAPPILDLLNIKVV